MCMGGKRQMLDKLKYFFNHIVLRNPVMIGPQLTRDSFQGGFEVHTYYIQERIEIRRGKWGVTEWVYSDKLQRAQLKDGYVMLPPGANGHYYLSADTIPQGSTINVKLNVKPGVSARKA
jgi:hypothetical protein